MSNPLIRIHDLATDEVIDREMNDVEFAKHKKSQLAQTQRQAEVEAKATARQAVLDRLGLTVEEAQLLLGGN